MVGWHHWLNGHGFEQTGRYWRAVKPGILQFMESQKIGQNLVTEQTTICKQYINKQQYKQTIYACTNILTVCIPYSRTWLTVSIVSNFIWLCFIQCCLLYLAPGAHFLMSLNVYLCLAYFSFMPMISLLLKILLLQKGMKMNIEFPLGYKHCSLCPGRNFTFKVFCSIILWETIAHQTPLPNIEVPGWVLS